MNVPSHMSGQVPNQGVPRMTQQIGAGGVGMSASQLQGMGVPPSMDREFMLARGMMRERISQYIQGHQLRSGWLQRIPDIAKRMDDHLYKHASSKEDYMNLETLENRLQSLIKGLHNQQSRRVSSSAQMSTMIPTPGMSHGGSTNVTASCSADNPMVSTNNSSALMAGHVGTGTVLQTSNGAASVGQGSSFKSSDRSVNDGYRHPSVNNSMGTIPPNGLSHSSSQMIPTPGLNNAQSMPMNLGGSGLGCSSIESTVASQQPHQKQFIANQNGRILQNLGGQLGVGLRSNMQQRYELPNGGLTYMGNQQLMNGSVVSEGYLSSPSYSNTSKPLHQQFDQQHPQLLRPRDGYGMSNITGDGNLYNSATPAGPTITSSNIGSLSRSKTSSTPQSYQPNLQQIQQSAHKPLGDHSQKMEFQSPHVVQENLLQNPQQFPNYHHQQFPQQTSQTYAQFVQHQFQPQQQLVENGQFRQPLLPSTLNGQLNEALLPQAVEEFQLPELPGYQQNNMVDNNPMGAKPVGQLSTSQNMQSSISHDPRQMHQMFEPAQQNVESQNNFSSLSNECQPEALLQGEWHSQTPEKPHLLDQTLLQHHIHNNFQQQLIMQDDGQRLHFPLEEGLGTVSGLVNGVGVSKSSELAPCDNGNALRAIQYRNQRRWLLFLGHARHCSAPRGKCLEENCTTVQDLWLHMSKCNTDDCTYPRCKRSKALLRHYRSCQAADCPVCVPVRNYIASKYKARPSLNSNCVNEINGSRRTVDAADADKPVSKTSLSPVETSEELQISKRLKVEHVSSKSEIYSRSPVQAQSQAHPPGDSGFHGNHEVTTVKVEPAIICGPNNPAESRRGNIDDPENIPIMSGECQLKPEAMQVDKDFNQPKFDIKQEASAPVDPVSGTKSGKPKIKGVSLTELFTPEQVRQHILGLRQWVGQSKAKAEKNQAMEHSMSENSCQLCAVEKLTFDPPPIYCSICGARIKRNAMYYACGSNDTRNYLCIPCHNDARGDTVEVEGSIIPKAKFEKKKNDEETEEWWVQCDKCEAWQHQICALFNGRRNEGGQAEYTCPNCYVQEVERGERRPLLQSAVLGADDLPKTLLSDHLEQRLFRRLKQERQDRARIMGKSADEVPGAEGLVIRVVSSVDKKLDVKPRFLEIFQEDNYPTEFPYKSKVVLLFQKIEGVEVCLFGMYVQEFGSECQFPNQRRVYLSYLDSVKYFRPEIKAMTGEALRTFVYHEILIGYLEYCKKRGFTSCYIWACPPLKGEDYILYCHPEIQKTPKSDKLREWYLQMLRKATKENIVVDLTNLYDHFFTTMGECKAKVTAARLPYFDGDYWPGAAEDMINLLQQEEDGRKQQKKGKTKKTITKRALKAAGHTDLSGNASKDALLMHKLGETISPMKEDFIMVHLQHACNHCCLLMVSGIRWVCNQCKNFQLCERCYDSELKREERDRHPTGSRDTHSLSPIAITDVPSDTKDRDDILESEFFDTRQAFLSLCQGNHYQYDTLRRAKHSSMMVLYHLHNPTAPAFVTTCNVCQRDIEAGQGWRCEVCPDFDVCNNCYRKDGGVDHPHKLTNHPSMVDAQNTEARQKRVVELRKMLNLLVHASQCRVSPYQPLQCQYPDCRKVKGLFRHGKACRTRASGGCLLCKRMWHLLQLHARACKESECHVPRCRDLKDHLRRLQQQSESRRRAAVNEMMRQRAVEVAGSS